MWIIKMLLAKKFIFQKTPLDKPIIIFLAAMLASTAFSYDKYVSIFGYYSNFNGGILSYATYFLIYWAYVSNINILSSTTLIRILFFSTAISSVWAIMEHFGYSFSCLIFSKFQNFDTSCWVQDVQNRVFSTFGQPNWLAAWLSAIMPLAWPVTIKKIHSSDKKFRFNALLYAAFVLTTFLALVFTKSRSGILALAISFTIFFVVILFKYPHTAKKKILRLLALSAVFFTLLGYYAVNFLHIPKISENALDEDQNYESFWIRETDTIQTRKIVWKGALQIWKGHILLGTGPETFAFSYYQSKLPDHNLTPEWNVIFTKAHNEYLNFLANTGIIGLASYLILIASILILFIKNIKTYAKGSTILEFLLNLSLLAGFLSILTTNFFGFSTVPLNVLFFIFPALAFPPSKNKERRNETASASDKYQQAGIAIVLLFAVLLLYSIHKYWINDVLYQKAKSLNQRGEYTSAYAILSSLTQKNPRQPIYLDEFSNASANLALQSLENLEKDKAKKYTAEAIDSLTKAIRYSPFNIIIKIRSAERLIFLSAIDEDNLSRAKTMFEEAVKFAPTDANIRFNLGLTLLKIGDVESAIENIEEAIALKPNYEKARLALALIYANINKNDMAKEQIEYLLRENPENINARQLLEKISSSPGKI
jgi:tetratricopeptide (TPR) repeat protein